MIIIRDSLTNVVVENRLLGGLLLLIVFDIFSGIVKAFKEKRINSSIGLIGLLKHSLVIMVNITIVLISPIFEIEKISNSLVIFYIVQYGFSIIENFVRLGVPVPKFLYDMLLEKSAKYEKVE